MKQNTSCLQVFCILFFLGSLTYCNAIFHPFVHDDIIFIQNNPNITQLDIKGSLLRATSPVNESPLFNNYYRPLIEIIHCLEYKIFGLNPHGYHLVNILIHIVNSLLVYLLAYRIFIGRQGLAICVAVLFLIHPVQTESVACISGISNLVFAFFVLTSLLCYIKARAVENGKFRMMFYYLSLILFFIGFFAKEQTIILPFIILLYEFTRSGKGPKFSAHALRISGYFLVFLCYSWVRTRVIGISFPNIFLPSHELWLRLLTIPRTLMNFLSIIVYPHDLHYYRSIDILDPYMVSFILFFGVACIFIFIIFRSGEGMRRNLIFGLLWFLITLGPTLNIIPLYNEYSFILSFEHFLYVPLIGILIFLVWVVDMWIKNLFHPHAKVASLSILTAVSFIFFIGTIEQNRVWGSEVALFERTLKYQPTTGRIRMLMAKAYFHEGRYEDAIREDFIAYGIMNKYRQIIQSDELKEFYNEYIKQIYFDIAHSYEALGDNGRAIAFYQKAIAIDPQDSAIINNLGTVYLKIGENEKAKAEFDRALALDKKNLLAMNNLAIYYIKSGDRPRAEAILRDIVRTDSSSGSAEKNLQLLLWENKQLGL